MSNLPGVWDHEMLKQLVYLTSGFVVAADEALTHVAFV